MPAEKPGLPPFPIQEKQNMWSWQCLCLEWAGEGWDISLEQVTQSLLGVRPASEASKGHSGTMLKRRDVMLENPCVVKGG